MTKRCLQILPLILIAILTSTNLHAQAKLAVYGTVGGEKPGVPNEWGTAGTVGLYVGVVKLGPLALSVDGRADLASKIKSGLVGPRLALHLPAFPLKPYVEVLIGRSSYPNLPNGLPLSSKFVGRGVVGVDTTILPRIDWRVVEFTYGITTATPRAMSLTTGLVLRF
ncbi:MAG: hypothetical protein ABI286_00090 [Edaphobacter sp.]